MVYSEDPIMASAAISALGKIGAPAAKPLTKAKQKSAANQRAISDALLLVAEDLIDTGDVDAARAIYKSLNSDSEEAPVRKAAEIGLNGTDPILKLSEPFQFGGFSY
jgi:thioredoxin-like negative regulator of GroEL